MYDRELVLEMLTHIYGPTQTILKRFQLEKAVFHFPIDIIGQLP